MNALNQIFESHKAAFRSNHMPADVLQACYDVAPECTPSDEIQAFAKRAVATVVETTGVESTVWKTDLKQAAILIFRALSIGSNKIPPIAEAQMTYYVSKNQPLQAAE